MPASFMTLPFELREQILVPVVRTRATIELQYPLWADTDKSVFAPPVAQVCRELREEVFQCFYRANVFVWKIDSEPEELTEPSTFPLEQRGGNSKHFGPSGPLISSLPWQYPHMLANLRHLRLNLNLPPQHDIALWTDKLSKQLSRFVEAIDHGQRLKDLKVLIGTWHKLRELGEPQSAALNVLERMQVRGSVQVRTSSLDRDGKASVQRLDLGRRMKVIGSSGSQLERISVHEPHGNHLDWEWEGGATVTQLYQSDHAASRTAAELFRAALPY